MTLHGTFISELVGRRALVNDLPIGKVTDFLVSKPGEVFPQIDGLVIKTSAGARFAPIGTVADINSKGVVALTITPSQPAPPDDEALYLVSDLLDKQIVDVDGRKVVRINDLELTNTGGVLRVVAADVGVGGLLRRLGLESLGRAIAPRMYRGKRRATISWNNVAPIRDKNPTHVQLSVAQSKLARLHPSDLAEIIGALSSHEAAAVFHSLDDGTAADALEHLDLGTQTAIIEDIGTERAADIIEEMDSDDAADLLSQLPEDQQTELLSEIDNITAGELRELVKYQGNTAGGLMTTDYVWIYPHRTAESTIDKIREIAPETEFIYYLYVTDESEKLLGVLTLRTLLLARPQAKISEIMETDIVSVSPVASGRDVAAVIARYDILACPVVEEHGRMLGIVTVDDAIDVILPEKFASRLPRFHPHHHKTDKPLAS
ncbi:MAG: CBS domain-containing protein [Candidatus Eremiobacteraeota bacterium]|nr:CBS domain-containing protein [Candidatus Eremiobacteraeota bacterium]